MSGDGEVRRFAPRQRRAAGASHDRENLMRELQAIRRRVQAVAATSRDAFHDGSDAYDIASMVIIRLAALFERPEFASYLTDVTREERQAISTTRNIAAHTGYRSMNDDLFWLAVTHRVPRILDRLTGAGEATGAS
ncbi:antitoxin [Actinobaculum sp. 313]|uniref:antitoxin n=1 Tax=Actinobaculum sp. 313 TaxID=2495645 RepID=UPI000D526B6C|nr:antitoxin [Actinobaculum sp. 313]AWE41705.1 antitoxin [Actinobaculum sp. 313]